MVTALVVLLAVICLLVAVSVALGRTAREVESARDNEYVELEGTWVRYNVVGGGPPVLLVHGWLSSSRIWDRLVRDLEERFTVYTLDLRGFGESDKPLSGYGIRQGGRLLYAFCAHFGLTGTAVVGHDIGGDMALKLAADRPDVVGQLALVAAPAEPEQIDLPTPLWLATLPVVGPLFYALGRAFGPLRRLWLRPFVLDKNDLAKEVVEDAGKSTPAAVGKTINAVRREISRGRLVRQARVVKAPILLLAGEEDRIVNPDATEVWARNTDRAEIRLLKGCGHLPMIEHTEEFNASILDFLSGDYGTGHATETPGLAEMGSRPFAEEEADTQDEPSGIETEDLAPPGETAGEPGSADRPNVRRKREGRYPPRVPPPEGPTDNRTERRADDAPEYPLDRPKARRLPRVGPQRRVREEPGGTEGPPRL